MPSVHRWPSGRAGGREHPNKALRYLPPQGAVPVVLDVVVGAARQRLGDLGPRVAVNHVLGDKDDVLFWAPIRVCDRWVQMVAPPGK